MEAEHRGRVGTAPLSLDIRKVGCQLNEGRLRGTDDCRLEPIPNSLRGRNWPAVVVVKQDIRDVVPVLLQTTAPSSVNLGEQVRRQRCHTKLDALGALTEAGRNRVDLPVLGGEAGAPQVDCSEELAVVERDRRLVG